MRQKHFSYFFFDLDIIFFLPLSKKGFVFMISFWSQFVFGRRKVKDLKKYCDADASTTFFWRKFFNIKRIKNRKGIYYISGV